jgi:hypothetical protein
MIDDKNYQQLKKHKQLQKINTYLQHYRTSPKKYENPKLVVNHCNILSMLFKQKIVRVCYIFKQIVHGRLDLDENIITSRICFRYKNFTHLLEKITNIYNIE